MALFCGVTLVFLVYRDLTLPEVRGVEVWFGFELHGDWARITAPIHWGIFGFGCLAFHREWRPIWAIAVGYAIYVAISHLLWNLSSESGGGLGAGLWQAALFSIPALFIAVLARSSANWRNRTGVPKSEPSRPS